MKECPYCDEQIQSSAKKCRYCGEWIENTDLTSDIEIVKIFVQRVRGEDLDVKRGVFKLIDDFSNQNCYYTILAGFEPGSIYGDSSDSGLGFSITADDHYYFDSLSPGHHSVTICAIKSSIKIVSSPKKNIAWNIYRHNMDMDEFYIEKNFKDSMNGVPKPLNFRDPY